jgi:hypothetical protein
MAGYIKLTTRRYMGAWRWLLYDCGEVVDHGDGFAGQPEAREGGRIAKRLYQQANKCKAGWVLTDTGIRRRAK